MKSWLRVQNEQCHAYSGSGNVLWRRLDPMSNRTVSNMLAAIFAFGQTSTATSTNNWIPS